jgi:hypothetical protein
MTDNIRHCLKKSSSEELAFVMLIFGIGIECSVVVREKNVITIIIA